MHPHRIPINYPQASSAETQQAKATMRKPSKKTKNDPERTKYLKLFEKEGIYDEAMALEVFKYLSKSPQKFQGHVMLFVQFNRIWSHLVLGGSVDTSDEDTRMKLKKAITGIAKAVGLGRYQVLQEVSEGTRYLNGKESKRTKRDSVWCCHACDEKVDEI